MGSTGDTSSPGSVMNQEEKSSTLSSNLHRKRKGSDIVRVEEALRLNPEIETAKAGLSKRKLKKLHRKEIQHQKYLCPLCPPSSQKRFTGERSVRMHVTEVHVPPVEEGKGEEDQKRKRMKYIYEATERILTDEKCVISCEEGVKVGGNQMKKGEGGHSTRVWVDAAKKGDVETLQRLLSDGKWRWADKDHHGANAEQWCAGSGKLTCLKFCVWLRFQSCPKHSELIKTMDWAEGLLKGESINTFSKEKSSLGTESSDGNNVECHCEKPLTKRKDGRSSLHWASRNGHEECIEFLVEDCDGFGNLNIGTYDGTTPLMYAVFGGHLGAARKLVTLGADPKIKNHWNCDLTHWAAMSECLERETIRNMCNWIYKDLGMEFTSKQKEGRTPLHKAAFKNHIHFIDWLVERMEASTDAQLILTLKSCFEGDLAGQTPSQLAENAGHLCLAERLSILGTKYRRGDHNEQQ
eukprot:Nk52_evm18s2133 gene=Nk52_evmTU18s2133